MCDAPTIFLHAYFLSPTLPPRCLLHRRRCSLLKHIIRCYLRLADNTRAREALRQCLPEPLKEPAAFVPTLKTDVVAQRWLQQLLRSVFPETPVPLLS
jgi:hypothetical protein